MEITWVQIQQNNVLLVSCEEIGFQIIFRLLSIFLVQESIDFRLNSKIRSCNYGYDICPKIKGPVSEYKCTGLTFLTND